MKFSLLILLAVMLVGTLTYVPAQVHADCADVVVAFDARQFFAPLQVEVDFLTTPDRSGDWTSLGLQTGEQFARTASLQINSNSEVFQGYGNDTYTFWVSGSYAVQTAQNITVTVVEGDRPPAREQYCMNGTYFYLKWTDQTLVVEQHPPTLDQIASSVLASLGTPLQNNANGMAAVVNSENLNTGVMVILILVVVGIGISWIRFKRSFGR